MKEKRTRPVIVSCLTVLLLTTVLSLTVYGDVPQQINYQGYLEDSDGVPMDGIVDITFSLYDVDTAGIALWTETLGVDVIGGIFNVILGDVNPIDLAFDTQYYLGVRVDTDEEMTPRQPLTSVGYALRASVADSIAEGAVTTVMIQDAAIDTAKVADSAITEEKIENGTVSAAKLQDGASLAEISDDAGAGSGLDADMLDGLHASSFLTTETDPQVGANTTNVVPKWNGSALVTGSIYDDGSIGIGTPNPDYKLDVRGDRIQLKEDASGDWIAMRTDGDAIGLQFEGGSLYFQSTSDGENILLNPTRDSFVGIGTESPQSALNILGGSWDLFNTEGDFKIGGPTNRLKMGIARGGLGAGTANILAQGGVNTLNLGSGDKYVVTIKDDKVGIGTTPTDKLTVSGDITATGNYKFSSAKTYYLNMPACAFRKKENYVNTVWSGYTGPHYGFKYTSSAGISDNCRANAPVYLPEGATVTSVTVLYYDNHPSQDVYISFDLMSRPFFSILTDNMASLSTTSSGTSMSIQQLTDDTINFVTISSNYCYWLGIRWDPTNTTFSSDLRFYGARIEYTLTTIAP